MPPESTETMGAPGSVFAGNVEALGSGHGGWFFGHFMTEPGLTSVHLEMKWGRHAAGESRPQPCPGRPVTSLSVLVSGDFVLLFPDRECRLRLPGDFALWGPGVPHGWRAAADSVVLTVRWPSLPA